MGVCFSLHAGGKDTGSKSEQEQQHVVSTWVTGHVRGVYPSRHQMVAA